MISEAVERVFKKVYAVVKELEGESNRNYPELNANRNNTLVLFCLDYLAKLVLDSKYDGMVDELTLKYVLERTEANNIKNGNPYVFSVLLEALEEEEFLNYFKCALKK